MAFNECLLNDFKQFLEINSSFSKKDLISFIGKSFDNHKTVIPRKKLLKLGKNGEEKQKKPPNAYQLFMKEHIPELKARENAKGEGEEKLNNKDLFKEVARLWNEKKVKKDELSKYQLPPIKGVIPEKNSYECDIIDAK